MTIFEVNIRKDTGRKRLSESVFAYLNRSAKPGNAMSRNLIEEWLAHVPQSERVDLCARFRSGDNVNFGTAFQELFLHEFLLRQKCQIEVHPTIGGISKRPDFLIQEPDGVSFILEARTSTDVAGGPKSHPRGDRVRDFLREMTLDGYKLGIDELAVGAQDLPQRPFQKHILDAISAKAGTDIIAIPAYSTPDGWKIRLTAFSSARYGSGQRTTLMQELWSRTWTGPSYPLREALNKKAGKYGQLAVPYVIAINSADVMLTDQDFEATLFGVRPGITIAGMTDELARGFWGTERAPAHRRVSAVLFTKNLWPATVLLGQVYVCLYLNPWADRQYEGLLTHLPTFRFESGRQCETPATPWYELMNMQPLSDSSAWD